MFDEIEPACDVEIVNALPHGFLGFYARAGRPASLVRVSIALGRWVQPILPLFTITKQLWGSDGYNPVASLYPFGSKHV